MIGPYYITSDARRRAAYGAPCGAKATEGSVVIAGRTLRCRANVVEAYQAYEQLRAHHGYVPTGTDTGIYSCRHMQHNEALPMSFHSWGIPIDINWLQNPAGNKLVTDIPKPLRDDWLSLKTNSGAWVFRWGADWDRDGSHSDHTYIDAMHWEPYAHPLDLATGIEGFVPSTPGDDMGLLGFNIGPMGAASVGGPVGDPTGDKAQSLQEGLMLRGYDLPQFGADRFAGDETRTAFAAWQNDKGITGEGGVMGPVSDAHWSIGVPGPRGAKGATGAKGAKGDKGDPGDSRPVTLTIKGDTTLP